MTLFPATHRLVTHIISVYGYRVHALVLLMALVALGEGLSMAMLLPLFGAIGISSAGETGIVQQLVSKVFAFLGMGASLHVIVFIVITVVALQMLLYVFQTWWISVLHKSYGAWWQKRLCSSFMYADWSFLSEQKLGVMMNSITTETARLSGAFLIVSQLASTVIITCLYIILALSISWQVTVVLLVLAIILFVSLRGVSRKNYFVGLAIGPLNAELTVLLNEFYGGIRVIKSTVSELLALQRVFKVVDEIKSLQIWASFLPSLVRGIFEFASLATLCVVLAFGYSLLSIAPANMILVLALFVRLIPRFNSLLQNVQLLNTYLPAFKTLDDLVMNAENKSEQLRMVDTSTEVVLAGDVRVNIREAGYGDKSTLHDLKIDLPQEGIVGIVGESGAGKTTLINCLLGFVEVRAGNITLGSVDMRAVSLRTWRRMIGYVPQETSLFHLSVRENIAWGIPDASNEAVIEAAHKANAHEFIMSLSHGYDTQIGDQGLRLSGGQRQRLGIARALMGKPRLLLLDEATSALDSASEEAILATINNLCREICVVSVAHRLATVRNADIIIVLDQGTIAESGNWEELMSQEGKLFTLATKQGIR